MFNNYQFSYFSCSSARIIYKKLKKGLIMQPEVKKIIINLKKAHSHTVKVIKMLEDGEYCVDVMQQNLAVIGLLKSAHQMLLENHLHTCFYHAMKTSNAERKEKMIDEILSVSKLAVK